ncbi:MAG: shikimate kinase [Flavobacteriaceae bacterium]|nr:shikimate kinase [Flavobacteriaceae bacterium]
MRIVLIGYMGSGKTVVGKQISETLGYPFLDLDHLIETNEKKKISKIFSEKGEIYFRRKEIEALKETISTSEKMILSTGGGTPCYGDTMNYLNNNNEVVTIYLKASLDVLTDRLFKEKANRPLIAHTQDKSQLNDFIRKHLFERAFYYNQASLVITVDEKTISEINEEIIIKLF